MPSLVWKAYPMVSGSNLALRSKVVKYVALFSLEKMSSTFGMGHVNFLVTLLRAL